MPADPLRPRRSRRRPVVGQIRPSATAPPPPKSSATQDSESGFLLTDLSFKPIYANGAAVELLTYPGEPSTAVLQDQMRAILKTKHAVPDGALIDFHSGRRRYVCRAFVLDSLVPPARRQMLAFFLERFPRRPIPAIDPGRRFRLSPRERETLEHLKRGLKTAEIAERMHISPNTVKQFIRAVGNKVGASTRSGIVGKVMSGWG